MQFMIVCLLMKALHVHQFPNYLCYYKEPILLLYLYIFTMCSLKYMYVKKKKKEKRIHVISKHLNFEITSLHFLL